MMATGRHWVTERHSRRGNVPLIGKRHRHRWKSLGPGRCLHLFLLAPTTRTTCEVLTGQTILNFQLMEPIWLEGHPL